MWMAPVSTARDYTATKFILLTGRPEGVWYYTIFQVINLIFSVYFKEIRANATSPNLTYPNLRKGNVIQMIPV
jgi:hypothetical protein